MIDSEQGFQAIINQVLSTFADLYEWRIKERLELFLMSILQRGAFLLDMVENPVGSPHSEFGPFDPFSTQQAQEFFDGGIKELFEILACDGGIPEGSLRLGQAIIGKIPTVEGQSQFRGQFFFQWYMQEFLRIAITYPEVCSIHANIARSNLARMRKCFFSFISVTKPGLICCIASGIALSPWRTTFLAQCKFYSSLTRNILC